MLAANKNCFYGVLCIFLRRVDVIPPATRRHRDRSFLFFRNLERKRLLLFDCFESGAKNKVQSLSLVLSMRLPSWDFFGAWRLFRMAQGHREHFPPCMLSGRKICEKMSCGTRMVPGT